MKGTVAGGRLEVGRQWLGSNGTEWLFFLLLIPSGKKLASFISLKHFRKQSLLPCQIILLCLGNSSACMDVLAKPTC